VVVAMGVGSGAMIETRRSWWIAPAVLLCAFVVLLWQVVAHGPLTRLDVHVRDGIQGTATSAGLHWLAQFGRACADLGDQAPALLSLLLATGLAVWRTWSVQKKAAPDAAAAATDRTLWRSPLWRPVLLAIGAGLVLLTVIPLKIWVARPGPGEVTLGNASLGFFPSGHTADALCCYGMAFYLLRVFVWTGAVARRLLAALTTLVIGLTIFGLLWSNYHWLSDILGSLCWCGAWLLVIWHCSSSLAAPPTGRLTDQGQPIGRAALG
jgi:membrane-associated phospholipid phosphatase